MKVLAPNGNIIAYPPSSHSGGLTFKHIEETLEGVRQNLPASSNMTFELIEHGPNLINLNGVSYLTKEGMQMLDEAMKAEAAKSNTTVEPDEDKSLSEWQAT
jgi:hypothetical protein